MINYEEEVKKVYPSAFINRNWTYGRCCVMTGVGLSRFAEANTESEAWESAYEILKQQGKL